MILEEEMGAAGMVAAGMVAVVAEAVAAAEDRAKAMRSYRIGLHNLCI